LFERPDSGDKALLVHVDISQHRSGAKGSNGAGATVSVDLEAERFEFVELANSAGLDVVDMIIGSRPRPTARHFIGKGKIKRAESTGTRPK